MEEKRDALQEYANEHCMSRLQAVYRLITQDEERFTEEIFASMDREEVDFAMLSCEYLGIQAYGGKERYEKKAQIDALQGKTGVDMVDPTLPNPFGKLLWGDVLKLILAILIPIGLIYLLRWPWENLTVLITAATTMVAVGMTNTIQQFFRYRKLVKLWKERPAEQEDAPIPSFDQCLNFVMANQWRSAFAQDLLNASEGHKKANLRELLWIPLYLVAMVVILAIGNEFGTIGLLVAWLALVVLAVWRCLVVLKPGMRVRRILNSMLNTRNKQETEKRLVWRSLGTFLIILGYVLLVCAGCLAGLDLV